MLVWQPRSVIISVFLILQLLVFKFTLKRTLHPVCSLSVVIKQIQSSNTLFRFYLFSWIPFYSANICASVLGNVHLGPPALSEQQCPNDTFLKTTFYLLRSGRGVCICTIIHQIVIDLAQNQFFSPKTNATFSVTSTHQVFHFFLLLFHTIIYHFHFFSFQNNA